MISYRPTPARLPGARSRAQAMCDGFGNVPSLLDSLVFYPVWMGSQCVDMISGAPLTNSANPVQSGDTCPNGELAGIYASASQNRMISAVNHRLVSPFIAASWLKIQSIPSSYGPVICQYETTGSLRQWLLTVTSTQKLQGWASPDGVATVTSTSEIAPLNTWILCYYIYDGSKIYLSINGRNSTPSNAITDIYFGTCNISLGAYYSSMSRLFDGAIGPTPIWKRLLSYREQAAYYANGQGINISQFFLG